MPHPSNKWTAPKGLRFISTVRCCIPHPPRHIHTFQTWFNNIIYSWTKYQRNDNETIQRMRYMAVEHNWGRIPGSRTPEGWSFPQDCPCARRCWTALRSCRLARWGSPPRSGRSWTPSRRAWWWVVLEKSDFWLVNISKQFKFSKEAETCQHKRQAFHFEQRGRWCWLRRGLSANQWSSPFQPGGEKKRYNNVKTL